MGALPYLWSVCERVLQTSGTAFNRVSITLKSGGVHLSFGMNGRKLRRLVATTAIATAIATAMTATAGAADAAGDPAGAKKARAAAESPHRSVAPRVAASPRTPAPGQVATPTFSMTAVDKSTGNLYLYFPDRQGGFQARYDVGVNYDFAAAVADVDNNKDGYSDGTWNFDKDGLLTWTWIDDAGQAQTKDIGRGWTIYNKVLSPGDLGGAQEADLMAVDKSGVMWVYLGYADGRVAQRVRIGAGWDQYTQIAGQGDLTGDGKADIVARDKSGVLWLYQGTGDYTAPFKSRTRIGAGWNMYDRLLSVGDLDADGKADIVARTPGGDLYRYSGTGAASAPLSRPVKIGYGYSIYNLL